MLEHLEEYPLSPLVVTLFGGVDDSRPVEREAYALELIGKFYYVVVGYLAGVNAGLDGGVLGGQTVCVKADGEQYVVALKPSLAAYYLKARISLDMTDVHTCAGGVGELYESVEFRLGTAVFSLKGLMVVPVFLPLTFYGRKVIFFLFHFASCPFIRPIWRYNSISTFIIIQLRRFCQVKMSGMQIK